VSETEATRLVTFRIGDGLYAVDVAQVERVIRYAPPRRVPQLPEWIEGLMEHDGRVIAIIDLRQRLGGSAEAPDAQARLLLLNLEGDWCGMIVDQVMDVRVFGLEAVTPPPDLVRGLAGKLYTATVKRGDALVVVLDLSRLFSAAERRDLSIADAVAPAHA
jgi:purine-binding chemotaxis protein CheW